MSRIPTGSTGEACPVCREDYDNCDCPEVTGHAPARQMPLSPRRKVLWPWFVVGALNAVAFAGYGHWRDQRGFERGADSAICAMAITLDGNSAIGRFEACRNIRDHSWYIDGFSRRGKGKGA